jgi:hypothetical protein
MEPTTRPVSLPALPPTYTATREALHRVAEAIVSPARVAATGNEIALEVTPRGFGTPELPDGGRVRVELDEIVVETSAGAPRRARLTSLAAAASLAGLPADGLSQERLAVDRAAAGALAKFYALGADVLRELHGEAPERAEASPIRLWPEHFDVAFEQGEEADGRRAGYGFSPGDEQHSEPYAYVVPWAEPPSGPGWTAVGFRGAELGYAELRRAADPRAAALAFLRDRRASLLGPPVR